MSWSKVILLSLWAVITACARPPTAVQTFIYAGPSAMLVAYREGAGPRQTPTPWQTPTPVSANADGTVIYSTTTYGNYLVTVVCDEQVQMTPGITTSSWTTYQLAVTATLGEAASATGVSACLPQDPQHVLHVLHGQMVQPGVVGYGGESTSSTSPDWSFDLMFENGSILYAISADKIAVRRNVSVGADTVLTPAIDLDAEGIPLVDTAFSISNPGDGEHLEAFIGVGETYELPPAQIYDGPPGTAKVAPEAACSAGYDPSLRFQTASLRANRDISPTSSARRAMRRMYCAGDDTPFTLPPPIADLGWEVSSKRYTARWISLPADHDLRADIVGSSASGHPARYALYMDAEFLNASGSPNATIDTDLPGYKQEWRVDLSQRYSRTLTAQQVRPSGMYYTGAFETSTSLITESMNGSGALEDSRHLDADRAGPRPVDLEYGGRALVRLTGRERSFGAALLSPSDDD